MHHCAPCARACALRRRSSACRASARSKRVARSLRAARRAAAAAGCARMRAPLASPARRRRTLHAPPLLDQRRKRAGQPRIALQRVHTAVGARSALRRVNPLGRAAPRRLPGRLLRSRWAASELQGCLPCCSRSLRACKSSSRARGGPAIPTAPFPLLCARSCCAAARCVPEPRARGLGGACCQQPSAAGRPCGHGAQRCCCSARCWRWRARAARAARPSSTAWCPAATRARTAPLGPSGAAARAQSPPTSRACSSLAAAATTTTATT
jgi:hypothetical protein